MTEQEWLSCSNPETMLEWLRHSGKASDRKTRLFAVACCYRIWNMLSDASRLAVEVAERFADGAAGLEELIEAYSSIAGNDERPFSSSTVIQTITTSATGAVRLAVSSPTAFADYDGSGSFNLARVVTHAANESARAIAWAGRLAPDHAAAKRVECELLRDIFGSLPLRSEVINPALVRWNDGTIAKMAQVIYDGRRFGDLPILADALEEAGADDQAILSHCRDQTRLHARGCWVIDLLLGKS